MSAETVAIFMVGSLTITPRKEQVDGNVYDDLVVELRGSKARLFTSLSKYEAMQLRDAITKWLEES